MNSNKLGAKRRSIDVRDIAVGAVQAPVAIPAEFKPDLNQTMKYFQGSQPACGAHAYATIQNILRTAETGQPVATSPRFFWTEVKKIDGLPLAVGTTSRALMQVASDTGICDFTLTGNNVELPLQDYAALPITQAMLDNAQPRIISAYAFLDKGLFLKSSLTPDSIKQAIYQNKAVLLCLQVDQGWFGTNNPTFTTKKWGHFVVAAGYDANGIYIIDSTEADFHFSIKYIDLKYFDFLVEAATVVDVPQATVQKLTQELTLLQQLVALVKQLDSMLANAIH